MTITQIQREIHEQLLRVRRVDRIVSSSFFTDTYAKAADAEKAEAAELVKKCDSLDLKLWVLRQQNLDIMSYAQIRQLARDYGIINYSRMTVAQLRKALNAQISIRRRVEQLQRPDRSVS